jgi:phage host-nuclease inhibitor protein Gam
VPTQITATLNVISLAEAEKAAHNWRNIELQILQKTALFNKELAELKEHQSPLEKTIENYSKQERTELFSKRKSARFADLEIKFRKAHDEINLKSGVTYEDVWKKVSSDKQIEKYPQLKSCIKPAELYKNRLKDLPEKLLNFLGLVRIKGQDEFSINLPTE